MTRIQLNWYDPNQDLTFEYTGDLPLTLGRLDDNDVVLTGVRVSRNHVRIEGQAGKIVLTDLDSSNGTTVNGKRIKNEQVTLDEGGQFIIDPFEFMVKVLEGKAESSVGTLDHTISLKLPSPLNRLPDKEGLIVQSHMEALSFPANTILFRQGDPTDGCYIVDKGLIRLELSHYRSNPDENEDVLMFIEPISFLGELSLLDHSTRSATAIAHTNIEVRKISLQTLEKLTKEYPAIAISMLTALGRSAAERLRQTTQQLDSLTSSKYDVRVEQMITDAEAAQQELLTWPEARVDELLQAIAAVTYEHAEALAEAAVRETQMGNVADKTMKNRVASMGVLQSFQGKRGMGLLEGNGDNRNVIEIASPVGIIFGLVPATNPTSTFIFKTLIAIKSRNAIILSPNRRAASVSVRTGELIREVLRQYGAPEALVQWVDARADRKLTITFMSHKKIGLILATGGSAMVKAAYSSGNPAIGVGPGNAPTFITDTADVNHAAQCVVMSKAFDNGLICGSEHNLVVVQSALAPFTQALVAAGAAVLTEQEAADFAAKAIDVKFNGFKENFVGQDAAAIADATGITRPYPIRLIVVPSVDAVPGNPFAREKMLPVLSLFSVNNNDDGLDCCQRLLGVDGRGHTAIIYSQDDALIRRFGTKMPASRILVNSPGAHGVVGISTALIPSLTLGCGTFGSTSTTDNVTFTNLMNIKRLAYFVPDRMAQFISL
jgi:acetaldehyde dehydrogenase / alcohol dehydrogenase